MDHEGCIQADLFARGEYYEGGEGREYGGGCVGKLCHFGLFLAIWSMSGQCARSKASNTRME